MSFLDILKHELSDVKPDFAILCVPKNAIHLLTDTIEEYKKVCPEIKVCLTKGQQNTEILHVYVMN